MGDILPFKKPDKKSPRKGMCQHGFHKWVVCKEKQFDVKQGKLVTATVVDHIVPHKGDYDRFYDVSNWQSLCRYHHNAKTYKELAVLNKSREYR